MSDGKPYWWPDVREEWDEIRPGLEAVREKINAPWRPEDVYCALMNKTAHLVRCEQGFLVLEPRLNALTGEKELLAWVAYHNGVGGIQDWQSIVDQIVRDLGYGKYVLWANRKGWDRVPGWDYQYSVYERTV